MKKKLANIATKESIRLKGETYTPFHKRHFHFLVIFFVSVGIYLNAIPNDYNLDDELVTQNHILTSKGISALGDIFSQPYYKDAQGYSYDYRPVALASFAIEHSFFGENPHISHAINVLLYGLLCMLLFSCLSALLSSEYRWLSFVACLLFAVHPTHTEVVASIKNRDELLALIGGLLSLRFAIKWIDKKNTLYLLLSLLFFVFGLMSKLSITSFAVLIPISLIFFRSITFSSVLIVALLLTSPFIYLSNIPQLGSRLLFITAIVSASLIFWSLKNRRLDGEKICVFISQALKSAKGNITDFNVAFNTKRWMQDQNAVFPALFLLSSGSTFLSFYLGMAIAMKIGAFFMLIFWLISIWEWKVLTLPIIFVFNILMYRYNSLISLLLPDLLLVLFFFFSYLSRGKQRIVFSLLSLALLSITIYDGEYNRFKVYASFSAILFLPIPKKIKYALAIFGMFIMFLIFRNSFVNGLHHLNYFLLVFIVLLRMKSHNKNTLPILNLTVSICMIVIVFFSNIPTMISHFDIFLPLNTANQIAAPSIIEAINRPLNFLETPINSMSPFAIKLGTSMDILGRYLQLLLAPYPLAFYYGYSIINDTHILTLLPLLILFLHLLMGLIGLYLIRKKPIISFSIFFYLISIASFLPIANPLPGMMADRYLLIPSIGFSIWVAYLLLWANQKANDLQSIPTPSKLAISAILILFSVVTIARNFDWKDRLTLFENDIKHIEKSGYAQNLLGIHLSLEANQTKDSISQKQLYEKACVHFQKSIAIYPDFLNSHFDLGRTLVKLNRNDKAIKEFEEAIRLQPSFSEPYLNIGILLDTKGQVKEAAEYYEKGLKLNPSRLDIYANLSYAYFRLNDLKSAITTNKKAIEIFPTAFQPYINLGKIFYANQQKDSALFYFEKANQVNPNQPDIVSAIATLYAEKNDPKANAYIEQLQRLRPTQ